MEHLARAAREDLHLRASVIMQVPEPAVSASQRKRLKKTKSSPKFLSSCLPSLFVLPCTHAHIHTHKHTHTHIHVCVCVCVCIQGTYT